MSRRRHRPSRLALVVLTAVWVLLWDRPSVFLVLTGLLLAFAVTLVFPLPPIQLHGRFRPLRVAALVGRLLADLVRSSAALVALSFRFGHTPAAAIIRVRLRSDSDLYLTQTAELVSLVPGSIVLEARRADHTLYLHVLDAVTPADLDRAAQDVLDAEERIIKALGSDAEIAELWGGDRG